MRCMYRDFFAAAFSLAELPRGERRSESDGTARGFDQAFPRLLWWHDEETVVEPGCRGGFLACDEPHISPSHHVVCCTLMELREYGG